MRNMSARLKTLSEMIENAMREFNAACLAGEDEKFPFLPELDEARTALNEANTKLDLVRTNMDGVPTVPAPNACKTPLECFGRYHKLGCPSKENP